MQDDLAAFHGLRTQPEVMRFTIQGRVDKDLAETQTKLDDYMDNAMKINFAICLRETGEMVGVGGSNSGESFGWPEVGYMIRKEHWGKGLASEFLRAFLAFWKELPRDVAEMKVDRRTVDGLSEEGGLVPEQLIAVTEILNTKSQSMLRKCGFEHLVTWKARDTRDERGELIELPTFRFFLSAPVDKVAA